jgi:predicted transcriptional regulator
MSHPRLSRRERQIVDALYRLGEATAIELQRALPDAPSNSALRTHLRILFEKGHITYRREGRAYAYFPKVPQQQARRRAIRHVLRTYCHGRASCALAALLDHPALPPGELEEMRRLISEATAIAERGNPYAAEAHRRPEKPAQTP